MANENIWLEMYLEGYELESSSDAQNWHPLTKEPYAGDGNYYRRAIHESHPVSTKSKQHLSHSYSH